MARHDKPDRRRGRSDDAYAFLPDPADGPLRVADDLAQELAEEYLISAVSGNEVAEDALNQETPEESGGPFIITSGRREFAPGIDASNPIDAERAPLPSPMRAT